MCAMLGAVGVLGGVSRLVIDLNREEDASGLIPEGSDGHDIPGNIGIDPEERAQRLRMLWEPYHRRIADRIAIMRPKMLISLHT